MTRDPRVEPMVGDRVVWHSSMHEFVVTAKNGQWVCYKRTCRALPIYNAHIEDWRKAFADATIIHAEGEHERE